MFLIEPIILSTAPIPAWCLGSKFNGGELQIEVGDDLHLSVNQVFASLNNVETSINPNDARCASQGEGSIKTSGDTLGAVVVQDF